MFVADERLAGLRRWLAAAALPALNLALLAALCWLLARWTWVFIVPGVQQTSNPLPPVELEKTAAELRSAHLFGVAGRAVTPAETRAATSLNLKLKGVFASIGKGAAVAIIQVEGKGDRPFRKGDTILPDVTLAEVYADHVLLRRSGVEERLDLERKAPPPAAVAITPGVISPGLSVRDEGNGAFSIPRNEFTRALSDPRQLAALGRVRVEGTPGGGLRIEDASASGLLSQLGLHAGDVIRRINGKPVAQSTDLLQGYREQLSQGGRISVEGTRNGQSFQYNYTLR